MFEQLTQLGKVVGPTAVVGVFAIYVLWQLLKEKRNHSNGKIGNNKDVIKAIRDLKGNCLSEINTKLDRLEDKDGKIIGLLIEIKTLITK